MNSKVIVLIAALLIVIAGVGVVVFSNTNNNNDDNKESVPITEPTEGIKVWLDDGNGNEKMYSGEGLRYKLVIEDALSSKNIVFSSNWNVESVGGVTNTSDHYWVVFEWSSTDGWVIVSDLSKRCGEGITLDLRYAEKITDNGKTTYSEPTIEVEYDVYFYLRIPDLNILDSMNHTYYVDLCEFLNDMTVTESEIEQGIWIKGTGKTTNDALADAVIGLMSDNLSVNVTNEATSCKYTVNGETLFSFSTRESDYGWFLSFLGWSDLLNGSGTYTYWTQNVYDKDAESLNDVDSWGYNDYSFGRYNIVEYKYFALILTSTTVDDVNMIYNTTPSEIPEGL